MTKRPSTRARIDWGAALAFFVAMAPPRTYSAVARRFKVSVTAVRRHAIAEQWAARAAAEDRKVAEALIARQTRDRTQRALQDAVIRDRAADLVQSRLDADDVSDDWVRQVLADADKRVRLNEGEATDNVAIAQVQAGFRDTMRIAIETAALVAAALLPEGKRAAFVKAYRERFLPAVNEALALSSGEPS